MPLRSTAQSKCASGVNLETRWKCYTCSSATLVEGVSSVRSPDRGRGTRGSHWAAGRSCNGGSRPAPGWLCPSSRARFTPAWVHHLVVPFHFSLKVSCPSSSQLQKWEAPAVTRGHWVLPLVLSASLLFWQSSGLHSEHRRQGSAGVCWHGCAPSSVARTRSLHVFSLSLCWSGCFVLRWSTALLGRDCILPGHCLIAQLMEDIRSIPSRDSTVQGWKQ